MKFLYRGVTIRFHKQNNGVLKPKKIEPFNYSFHWDKEGLVWDSSGTWDTSTDNAVIIHQLNQEGFPTSGISTTPHFERAQVYARGRDRRTAGFIYKLERSLFSKHEVTEFFVSNYVKEPSIPEDDEVILVSGNFGALPQSIVIEVIPIPALKVND